MLCDFSNTPRCLELPTAPILAIGTYYVLEKLSQALTAKEPVCRKQVAKCLAQLCKEENMGQNPPFINYSELESMSLASFNTEKGYCSIISKPEDDQNANDLMVTKA